MIKATLIRKRPIKIALSLQGRNAYGMKQVVFMATNIGFDDATPYPLFALDIDSMKEFAEAMNVAYKAAQSAPDTTPVKAGSTTPATQANLSQNALDILKVLQAVGIQIPGLPQAEATMPAPVAIPIPAPAPAPAKDDLDALALASILGIIKDAQSAKPTQGRSRNTRK